MSFSIKSGEDGDDEFAANSEINVTPFVDVMLVLLIVFMVTAPMLAKGVKVDLPTARAATTVPMASQPIVVTVKEGRKLFVNETEVTAETLNGAVKAELARQPDVMTHIRGAVNVPYGDVLDVMATLSAAGVTKLAFISRSDAGRAAAPPAASGEQVPASTQ